MPVKYGSERVLARELFQRVLTEITGEYTAQAKVSWREMFQRYRMEPTDLDSRIYLTANDNWLEFTLRYVVDYKRRRRTKDLLFTRLLEEIDRTAGRVTLASATVELVKAPELKVTLAEARPES